MTSDRLISIPITPQAQLIASWQEHAAHLTSLSPVSGQQLQQESPDAHWMLVRDDRELVARCSLWWNATPPLEEHRVGAIGHYGAVDAPAGEQLLHHACQELRDRGCTIAIGPMNGNTWRSYRLICDRGSEPIFFLEPNNPEDWPHHFTAQQFTPIAQYSSAVNTDLGQSDPRLERVRDRLEKLGIHIRNLEIEHFETELQRIYTIARVSFRQNFLYTPISAEEFIAQYQKIRPYLRPELIPIATHRDQPIGFLFALPDWLEAERDPAIHTIIIKTVAVLPGRQYAGLGNLFVAQCQETAKEMGYTRAIHALMHDANPSRNLSDRYAKTIRRYALFAKPLTP